VAAFCAFSSTPPFAGDVEDADGPRRSVVTKEGLQERLEAFQTVANVDVQDNLHVEAAAKLTLHCSSLELMQSMVLGTAAESEIKVSRRFALIFMNTD